MSKATDLMELVENVVSIEDLAGMQTDDCELVDGEVSDDPEMMAEMRDGEFIMFDPLDEKVERIVRVRGGKVERISKVVCPPGFRAQSGKCVKMSSQEMAARRRAGKKAAKKSHTGGALRRRALSMKKSMALNK